MSSCEHWDVAELQRTGYTAYQSIENRDTPENREEYIDGHMLELITWLRRERQEILDEFVESSGQVCMVSYRDWLN